MINLTKAKGRDIEKKMFDEFVELSQQDNRFDLSWDDTLFVKNEKTMNEEYDRHYVYHMAWAMKVMCEIQPEKHVDISSFLYFPVMLAGFIPVEYYEYRPADLFIENLECKQADLKRLPFADNSINSLSCMHTVEHIGLGRYGDEIDPSGDLRSMEELERVLAPGGDLLFVVPVGKPRIQFSAHRIYSHDMIIDQFRNLKLHQFGLISMIDRNSGIKYNVSAEEVNQEVMGCGCYWFKK